MRKPIVATVLIAVAIGPASAFELGGKSGGIGVGASVGLGGKGASVGVGATVGGLAGAKAGVSVGRNSDGSLGTNVGAGANVGGVAGAKAGASARAGNGSLGANVGAGANVGGVAGAKAGASARAGNGSIDAGIGASANVGGVAAGANVGASVSRNDGSIGASVGANANVGGTSVGTGSTAGGSAARSGSIGGAVGGSGSSASGSSVGPRSAVLTNTRRFPAIGVRNLINLPRVLRPTGRGGSSSPAQAPLKSVPGTPRAMVRACHQAITTAALAYGAVRVRAAGAGPPHRVRLQRGALAVPLQVRIDYRRQGGIEVRQAQVRCRLDTAGRVVAVT